MKDYVVEVDLEIETTLATVMPGVKWQTWKPYFVEENEGLIEIWTGKVLEYLAALDSSVNRVSSRAVKKALNAETVHPSTWKKITKQVTSSKESMGDCLISEWRLTKPFVLCLSLSHCRMPSASPRTV